MTKKTHQHEYVECTITLEFDNGQTEAQGFKVCWPCYYNSHNTNLIDAVKGFKYVKKKSCHWCGRKLNIYSERGKV